MTIQKNDRKITVVVPFLNEEENLPVLWERLKKTMIDQAEEMNLLLVDDGSTDGSAVWAKETAADDCRLRLLQLSRNFGHQAAITAGLDYASGDAVVIMDADLQDPPEVLPNLLARWREGFEVVYAVRRKREGEGFFKKLFAAGFYRIFRSICSVSVPVDAGDFRLLDRSVVDALKTMRETHRYMRGMISWVGFKQCAVEYDRAARHAGKTKYPVLKSLKLAWDGITSFSGKPLQWMTNIGVLVAGISALFAFYIIWGKIVGHAGWISGWASLSVLILFLGGVQLSAIGLLGQYISRIFDESKKRPLYIVRNNGLDV